MLLYKISLEWHRESEGLWRHGPNEYTVEYDRHLVASTMMKDFWVRMYDFRHFIMDDHVRNILEDVSTIDLPVTLVDLIGNTWLMTSQMTWYVCSVRVCTIIAKMTCHNSGS